MIADGGDRRRNLCRLYTINHFLVTFRGFITYIVKIPCHGFPVGFGIADARIGRD